MMRRKWLIGLAAAVVCFIGGIAVHAQIAGNAGAAGNSVPEQIPYRGYLENSGAPYNGPAWLRFEIYNVPTGGTALWSEGHPSVPVNQGQFGVALGSQNAFTTATTSGIDNHPLFQYPELYLAIEVSFTGPANYTALSQRQRILASPYAMTARQAEDLSASGTISAGHIAGILRGAGLAERNTVGTSTTNLLVDVPDSRTTMCGITLESHNISPTSTAIQAGTACDIVEVEGSVAGTTTYAISASIYSNASAVFLVACRASCISIP